VHCAEVSHELAEDWFDSNCENSVYLHSYSNENVPRRCTLGRHLDERFEEYSRTTLSGSPNLSQ